MHAVHEPMNGAAALPSARWIARLDKLMRHYMKKQAAVVVAS